MLIQYNLKWKLLRCVIIDGGKNMCGRRVSWKNLKDCENVRFLQLIAIHCIHQQVVDRKGLNLSCSELHSLLWT